MRNKIIAKVAIIGAVIFGCIFGYTLYTHPTKITIQPIKTEQSVKLDLICDNTAKFVEMCYNHGYTNTGSFLDLHKIIEKSSESDESMSFVSKICEQSFIAGKNDFKNGVMRDAYKVSNAMCHDYMKVL
jgi:hypothetical protein